MKCINPMPIKCGVMPYVVPCGQCMSCRINKAKMWAIRCVDELKYHDESIFLTLTYNEENLPQNLSLNVAHMQLFFKRLRKAGFIFRYFACGEYGDTNKRPHYHAIMFGIGKQHLDALNEKWGLGFIYIGDVTLQSCNYVAAYCQKKITGKDAKNHYADRGIIPEFCLASRRPAIGLKHFQDFGIDDINRGFRVHEGVKYGLPKYYRQKHKEIFPVSDLRLYLGSVDGVERNASRQVELEQQRHDRNQSHIEQHRDIVSQLNLNQKQRTL